MEFVKLGKNYIIKNSNGRVVSEKEKLQLENKELILKDIEGCNCQKETTKKLTKNKKRLKEIEQEEDIYKGYTLKSKDLEIGSVIIPNGKLVLEKTAPETKEADVDDTIKETD